MSPNSSSNARQNLAKRIDRLCAAVDDHLDSESPDWDRLNQLEDQLDAATKELRRLYVQERMTALGLSVLSGPTLI